MFPPPDRALIEHAATILTRGGLVCFPTETYYGLAVDALNSEALARLMQAKGRKEEAPIAVIVSDLSHALRLWSEVPRRLLELARQHWPGPLTIVAPSRQGIPRPLVGREGGVGARVSSHPWAHALAQALGGAITATSANRAGEPPAMTAQEARAQLGDAVDLYLDAGTTPGGPPSTVVVFSESGMLRVAREGAIPVSPDTPGPRG
ncbi:MAG: threonylcarbamoyl-AMP synthase [Deltaproteobacteria bacterium]|nr:threonylcarbamoyl-AMP synthase [Deltaproteobacteria bacterium]